MSAVQELRERVQQSRQRQNRILLLNQFSRWLGACVLIFLALTAIGFLFNFTALGWQVLFVLWALSVFSVSLLATLKIQNHFQNERRFIHYLEQQAPDLEQRLLTSMEFADAGNKPGVSEQFVAQLWQDAKQHVETSKPLENLTHNQSAWRPMGLAGIAVVATALALNYSAGFLEASRQFVWPWQFEARQPVAAVPEPLIPIEISVDPGDVSLQRGDDLTVTAALDNATADTLALYIQMDKVNWRRLTMTPEQSQPVHDAKLFTINLPHLNDDLVYYVAYEQRERQRETVSGPDSEPQAKSPQFQVTLFDLPQVESLALAYQYPSYTGLDNKVEDPGGDVIAPEGTVIELDIGLNKVVVEGNLRFDDGSEIPLQIDGNNAKAKFTVEKDDYYTIHLLDTNDKRNQDPEEYYVRAIADIAPEITLRVPGRDQSVMPLEEVPITFDVEDDYGISEFVLNYSVIGADDVSVDFINSSKNKNNRGNAKPVLHKSEADKYSGNVRFSGETMLYLEELDVQPGDVVSFSVVAADNNGLRGASEVVSDIYFLEVTPTDHEYSRAAGGGGGGGGGGGDNGSALVSIQKDVISATWKLKNRKEKVSEDSFAADSDTIRLSQEEVAQRAQMSINRLTERGDYENDSYDRAVEALQTAIIDMKQAVEHLGELSLTDALGAEQRALQSIMRAEAQVNKTQISMNRSRGGGGGGNRQEQDDLRELFEMEMGELENRYELPQQGQNGGQQQANNELMDRLKELARRQERIARAQRELARRDLDEEQRRRQLEQLRRQQEELSRDLQQLAQEAGRQQSGQQSPGQQQNAQSQPGQQSGQQQSGSQQGSQQANAQGGGSQNQQSPNNSLQRAVEQMQQAANAETAGQAAARAQKALDSLREQQQQWQQDAEQSIADMQQDLQQQAQQLVSGQQQLREQIEEASRQQSLGNSRSENLRQEEVSDLVDAQQQQRQRLEALSDTLRRVASQADEGERRTMDQAHDASRALKPIEEKMDTSEQILRRGMVNLSLKLEQEIESELVALRQQVRQLNGDPISNPDAAESQLANQVRQLRRSLEQLQQQASSFQQPGQLPVRRGAGEAQQPGQNQGQRQSDPSDSVGNAPATREQMQQTLQQARAIAQGLSRMGAGGREWIASARSIRQELTQAEIDQFLSRPELLRGLLQPVLEMEDRLRLQSELNEIDHKLYSSLDESVPEEYKKLVETYYRVLSENRDRPRIGD